MSKIQICNFWKQHNRDDHQFIWHLTLAPLCHRNRHRHRLNRLKCWKVSGTEQKVMLRIKHLQLIMIIIIPRQAYIVLHCCTKGYQLPPRQLSSWELNSLINQSSKNISIFSMNLLVFPTADSVIWTTGRAGVSRSLGPKPNRGYFNSLCEPFFKVIEV